MYKIYDKLILCALCTIAFLLNYLHIYAIIPIGIAIIFALLLTYIEHKNTKMTLLIVYFLLSLYWGELGYFIPLILYDTFDYSRFLFPIAGIISIFLQYSKSGSPIILVVLVLLFLSIWLTKKTNDYLQLSKRYYELRDTGKELELTLKHKNEELIKGQDLKLHVVTLDERNRIARDIHDSVGHVLSSAILQIGALIIHSKEPVQKESLVCLKDTLDAGMNSIRDSVHHLYDTSINLQIELEKLISDFTYCDIDFSFELQTPIDNTLTYTILSIVKESLTNIIKHSNATHVSVSFLEHPILYQLIIQDNGTQLQKDTQKEEKGIGIENIQNRVSQLNGTLLITKENGFRIFITIPNKKEM